jgi:hypothetical protein
MWLPPLPGFVRRAACLLPFGRISARALSDDPIEGFAFFEESMGLSKPLRTLKFWLSLRYDRLGAFKE